MPLPIQSICRWKDSEFTFEAKTVRFSIAPNRSIPPLSLEALPQNQFLAINFLPKSSARPLSPLLSVLSHGTLFDTHRDPLA